MSQEWHVFQGGQQKGPYTWEQLWQLVRAGDFGPGDLVWTRGLAGWIRAERVPGLSRFPAEAVTAPPPPAAGYTRTAASPPGSAAPHRAAPGKTGSGAPVALIVILLAVLLLAGGAGAAFFLLRDRFWPAADSGTRLVQPDSEGTAETTAPDTAEEPTPLPPEAVVDAFIKATLGSLPGAAVDYDRARSLMTAAYAASFDSPEFIPRAYGIQDGPDSYEIENGYMEDLRAEFLVWGFWGEETAMQWLFILQQEGGAWKITEIEVITPAVPGDEAAAQTPFWKLNPVTIEFTVYQNGSYKLVVEFDHPPEDIDAYLEVVYYRADDGTVAYSQEMSGVITTGHSSLTLDCDFSGYDLGQLGFKPGKHRVAAYIDGIEIASSELNLAE